MNTNHTPTPWSIEPYSEGTQKIVDADGEFLEFVHDSRYPDGRRDEEAEANAAFIVRACNAHDELVAALRFIADTDDIDVALDPQRAIRVARAALAKVQA